MSDTYSNLTGESGGEYCNKFAQDVNVLGMCYPLNCAFGVNQGRVTWTEDIKQPDQTYAWKLFGDPMGLIHPRGAIPASSLQPPSASTLPKSEPYLCPLPRRLPRHACHIPNPGRASQTPEGAVCVGGTAGYYRAPVQGRCQGAVTPAHGTPPARMYRGKCDGGKEEGIYFILVALNLSGLQQLRHRPMQKAIRCHSLQSVRGG